MKTLLALYFRFSLLDSTFNIYLDDEKITTTHLKKLGKNTQFLWKINKCNDPYLKEQLSDLKKKKTIAVTENFHGFIASVKKPSNLKVIGTEERATIDLFANGRLREKDILKYIPSARIVENYLYGQIHFNGLDDKTDRFSSSREGIVADDPKFIAFLQILKDNVLSEIIEDWDKWRLEFRESGDPDNDRITQRDRKSEELYNVVSSEYEPPEDSKNKEKVDNWMYQLASDAKYNFGSYAECFISENLVRKYIEDKKILLSPQAETEMKKMRIREIENKQAGNCNIDIRQKDSDTSYLDMAYLANLVDKQQNQNCLPADAKEYKPVRDALMHTALLTNDAKIKLTSVYNNIKGRVKIILYL